MCDSILQEGSVHSHVPSVMSELNRSGLLFCTLPSLEDSVARLQQLIRPYLTSQSQCEELCPAVLLTGPSGAGKSCISKAAAVSLNMHHYQVLLLYHTLNPLKPCFWFQNDTICF